MTSNDALDRRLTAWLEDEAVPHAPGASHARFIDVVADTRQRPGWATTERWISMETRAQLGAVPRAAIILVTFAMLALLVGAAVVASGTRALPPPFGVAGNGLIAYSDGGDVYVVEPDGSGKRQLTSGPEIDDAPTWSRDGTRIVYWSDKASGEPPFLLKVIDADGGEPTTIAQGDGIDHGYFMTWSADSTEVAYSADVPGLGDDPCSSPDASGGMCGSRIFTAAADGSGSRQIGDPDLDARNPELSPDGWTLAFGGGPAASAALYVMGWDGTDVRPLTSDALNTGDWGFVHSAWSSDGTRIVTQDGSGYPDIYVVAADGSSETNVSAHYTDELIGRFAPNDDTISWTRSGSGTMLLPPGATEPRAIPTFIDTPIWSPDGELLAGTDALGTTLLVVDRGGDVRAKIERLSPGFYPSWQRIAP